VFNKTSMNPDMFQQKQAQDQSQPTTKKPMSVGLFAGMNIKKKTAQPTETQPTTQVQQQLDQSLETSNRKSQNSSLFNTDSRHEEPKEAPDSLIAETQEVEKEVVEPEPKKGKKLPFFKNVQAKKPKPKHNESGDDTDLLQFSGAKQIVAIESNSSTKPQQGFNRNNDDEILDFDVDNFKVINPPSKAFNGANDLSSNDNQKRKISAVNQEQNSFDFLGNSQKKPVIHESSFDRSQQDVPLSELISSNGHMISHATNNEHANIISSTQSKIIHGQNRSDNDYSNNEKVEEASKPAKKAFGFIKKAKEKAQTKDPEPEVHSQVLEPQSRQYESKERLMSEDQPTITMPEQNPNENSFNEYSNTLEKINKDLSQISEKEILKDELEKSRDSREWIKTDSVLKSKQDLVLSSFAEKIKKDFRINQLDAKLTSKFEVFLGEVLRFIQGQIGKERKETESEKEKVTLVHELQTLEKTLTTKLGEEDYLAAEEIQQKIDALNNKLKEVEATLQLSKKTLASSAQEDSTFEQLKAEMNTELSKLMGDRIFIKEKKMFFQESQTESLTRKKESIAQAKKNAASELAQVQKAKSEIETKIGEKNLEMQKKSQKNQSTLDELFKSKESVEAEIEELRKALVKKENELFSINQNIAVANDSINQIKLKYMPDITKLEIIKGQRAEEESSIEAKFEDLSEQEKELLKEFETFESQVKLVDNIIASVEKTREKYKDSLDLFEENFNKLTLAIAVNADNKNVYFEKRKEYDEVLLQYERSKEEIKLGEKDVEKANSELEAIQRQLPELDAQKKQAVKDKNFSLANFHAKEQKRLEQLEATLKEEVKQRLVEIGNIQKSLPTFIAQLDDFEKSFSSEKLQYLQSSTEIIRLRSFILEHIKNFAPTLEQIVTQEVEFCKVMSEKFKEQENEIRVKLSKSMEVQPTPTSAEPANNPLNDSFIESTAITGKQTGINNTISEAVTHQDIKSVIKEDNEEEAWQNYESLYKTTKKIAELESKLAEAVSQEDYETAAEIQVEIDQNQKHKDELSTLVSSTSVYIMGSEDEMKRQYVEYLRAQISKLEASLGEGIDLDLAIINARLKKYQDIVAEFEK